MSDTIEVIFLGTGGGAPSHRRYLPSVAIRKGGEWLLFDAGEGAQMRLRESPLGWGGLRAIFISHLHGDHVLGLPGLLMSLGMAQITQPIDVYGPPGLQRFIETVLSTCRVQLPFLLRVIPIETIASGGTTLLEGDGFRVDAIPLRHRIPCFGFIWRENSRPGRFYPDRAQSAGVPAGPLYKELQQGRSVKLQNGSIVAPAAVMGPGRPGRVIAYCTDTAPAPAIIPAIRGADLLIHDATFGAGLEEEARVSGHSTAGQAAAFARQAGCLSLALTHISARYSDDAELLAEARSMFANSFVAADQMRIEIPPREA
ncbi:MAG TPA: ribonuclease Z [Armatimonadota bacterium]|nr:ribonuclease Z [Armatimonadota bacterium]